MLTLLIGGARSGKSDLAVELARRHATNPGAPGVTFIATARRFDSDMDTRIDRHRSSRPPWPTVEAPLDVDEALTAVPLDNFVIIDCLTLWLSNAMLDGWTDDLIDLNTSKTAAAAAHRAAPTVVVTNEVGMGVHPETELGRRYRDLLGRVNRTWAQAAHRSLLLVAGRATRLEDPWELLG